jgi:hypothetical protein
MYVGDLFFKNRVWRIESVPRWIDRGVYRICYTTVHVDATSSRYRVC